LTFPQGHGFVETVAEAACLAVRNGTTDVCSGGAYHNGLLDSVTQGLCSRDDVNAALYRTFKVRFQLGLFDPIETQPYWNIPITEVNTPAAEALNIQVAKSSMVLLKNDNNILPITAGKKIAVIGPHANSTDALLWNYLGQICPDNNFDCLITPFSAISTLNVGGTTTVSAGCKINDNSTDGFAAAIALAKASDIVILALGIDSSIETESHDRTDIDLPSIQHQLATVISGLGIPTVMVLFHAGSVDISPELSNPFINGILDGHYPGKRGSEAIALTLFGQNDLCCGKLSYTVYPASYVNTIAMSDMELDGNVGRGYRYYSGPTVLPFGYGLSFATFHFADISTALPLETLSTEKSASRILSYSVNVTNIGTVTGDDVVFLFMEPSAGSLTLQPESTLLKKLLDFQRVHLEPGASQVVSFDVSSTSLQIVDKKSGDLVSTPGEFTIVLTNGAKIRLDTHKIKVQGLEIVSSIFPANVQV
jgi:xylan 1,4-beta-xylosidase